ncbi:hypothetical protein DE146DRAFT_372209 [Phaeosphaeria sp. MPI-PUGE-AT-0046c]|nr:hypothetical protein DE146DRAFT_372209 [Phaeosphaeria sp. MPI-PUGE-AT-0046c]
MASHKPRFKAQADSRAARNRLRSPLLRLPGELRNRVYELAMSDTVVSVFPSVKPHVPYQLHAHLSGHATDYVGALGMSLVTNLSRVCRQIAAETRLLAFQSATFYIHSDGSFISFIDSLSNAKRGAISTIQISTPDAYAGGTLWCSVKSSVGNDDYSQQIHLDYLEWSWHLSLERLTGLKQVVVEEDEQWVYDKVGERFLREGISSCVRGRNIAIVIPEVKTWK